MGTSHILVLVFSLLHLSKTEVLVYPRILESRSERGGVLLHIHDGLQLNLEKSSVLARDFSFRMADGNETEDVLLDGRELQRDLYHDSRLQSSVIVKQVNGAVEVRGILNHELRIAPVAAAKRSTDGATLHKVFKVKERMNGPAQPVPLSPRQLESFWPHMQPAYGISGQGSDFFMVEVCVVTGRSYRTAFQTTEALIQYLAIMLNAVRLRYVDMVYPRISFQLNGVTAQQDDALLSYIQQGLVDVSQTLKNLKRFVSYGQFPACDIVFLLTEQEFASVTDQKVDKSVTGLAYVGGVCKADKVGVGEDKPHSYDGTYIWAHEMGHTLGATHDGDGPVQYIPRHPSAQWCPWADGYLMSYEDGGLRKYTLSPCSKRQIQAVFRTLKGECIQVQQQAIYKTSYYPGHAVTDRRFCQIMHRNNPGVIPYNRNNRAYSQCKLECCWVTGQTGSQISYMCKKYNMPEAMTCGSGMTCKRGVCGVHNWAKTYENSYG
ncbi:venom metalloproteinase antarease TserMP_A-like [Haemaphysalis longicornis]